MRREVGCLGCLDGVGVHDLGGEPVHPGGYGVGEGPGPPERGSGGWVVASEVSSEVAGLVRGLVVSGSRGDVEGLGGRGELLAHSEIGSEGELVEDGGDGGLVVMGDDGGCLFDDGVGGGDLVGEAVGHDDVDVRGVGS